jgi:DNA sulfur modification protein DndC
MGEDIGWVQDDCGAFGGTEARRLKDIADEKDVPPELVQRLLETERQHHEMKRQAYIYNEIDKVMREDWRPMEEIVADIEGEENIEKWQYTPQSQT